MSKDKIILAIKRSSINGVEGHIRDLHSFLNSEFSTAEEKILYDEQLFDALVNLLHNPVMEIDVLIYEILMWFPYETKRKKMKSVINTIESNLAISNFAVFFSKKQFLRSFVNFEDLRHLIIESNVEIKTLALEIIKEISVFNQNDDFEEIIKYYHDNSNKLDFQFTIPFLDIILLRYDRNPLLRENHPKLLVEIKKILKVEISKNQLIESDINVLKSKILKIDRILYE